MDWVVIEMKAKTGREGTKLELDGKSRLLLNTQTAGILDLNLSM